MLLFDLLLFCSSFRKIHGHLTEGQPPTIFITCFASGTFFVSVFLFALADFGFLLRFLRAKKFSQLEARKLLEMYWKLRSGRPGWFSNVDPSDAMIQKILRLG